MSDPISPETKMDSDDKLILDVCTGFFGKKALQEKIDWLVNGDEEKYETGWENWLKFELKFFMELAANKRKVVELEPQLFAEGERRQRADLLLNKSILIEIKRKIKISTCFRAMCKDFEKYKDKTDAFVLPYTKVYFIGIYHDSDCSDITCYLDKYFAGESSVMPLMKSPLSVGTRGHQVVILKHLLNQV